MDDQATAAKIVADAQYDGELNNEVSHEQLESAIVAALEAARRSVTDAAKGGIIDCTGDVPCVRKVLGGLPLTRDGVVVGNGAVVHHSHAGSYRMVMDCLPPEYAWQTVPVIAWGGSDHGAEPVSDCYASESAARAAMEGGKA